MIDRPIRPLFPKGWHYETQLVAQPISVDNVNPYDILAMNGASAALAISPVPVETLVGAVRIGKLDGDFVVNPDEESHPELEMDLIVSGSKDAILMVECGADGVTEAEVLDALDIAHGEIKTLIGAMEELQSKAGKEKVQVEAPEIDERVLDAIKSSYGVKLDDATQVKEKLARQDAINAVEEEALAELAAGEAEGEVDPEKAPEIARAFAKLEKDIIRRRIAVDKKRPDGRAQDEIRPIETEVDIAPRVHGSGLFTRGETQILSSATLGTTRMDMKVDNLGLQEKKLFWHHYNFPPFSVGEAGFMRGPKRRDIGHGALAERALAADHSRPGGVPVRDPRRLRHAGVERVLVDGLRLRLVDGPAGGRRPGRVPGRRRRHGPDQGRRRLHRPHRHRRRRGSPRRHGLQGRRLQGRDHRPADGHQDLGASPSRSSRTRSSRLARAACSSSTRWPRRSTVRARSCPSTRRAIESIKIDPEKIGAVIGKGGETIRGMQEEFEAEIDIDDDGTVRIYAPSGELVEACVARIESMTREAEIGDQFPKAQGRQDDHVRRLRRAGQGHRRPPAHLEREARRAGRHGRERPLAGRRDRRHRGRGRQGARPDRPASLRRPGDRGQEPRGDAEARHRRPDDGAAAAA